VNTSPINLQGPEHRLENIEKCRDQNDPVSVKAVVGALCGSAVAALGLALVILAALGVFI